VTGSLSVPNMSTTVKPTLQDLTARAGQELGASDYHLVTQAAIDGFAEATGDRQWIHTDPERAKTGLFGGTIAHGYYTLALAPVLLADVIPLETFAMVVNYGLDRVRFPAPLPVGERVRMRVALDAVDHVSGGAQLAMTLTFEREAGGKPVCVAQTLYRIYDER
jgi:acyl dehydratase